MTRVVPEARESSTRQPPLIGISAYSEEARWGVWEQPATLLPQNYVDQVAAAGGVPVLLPPVPGVEAAVGRLDGLVISGGPDVEPSRYGQVPGPRTTVVRPARDEAELALFRAALETATPVLGICRGMQLMNVALGGTLIQHLPDVVGHEGHSPTPGTMGRHSVRVGRSSCLAGIVGTGRSVVPTHHHQGIDKLGAGLVATAWADDDGTVEAFELDQSGHPFALGVQWHPEASTEQKLFRALIETASRSAVG
jgi:gamma-glutamyl-gamma-aminobutyrate hydrolase PuuD